MKLVLFGAGASRGASIPDTPLMSGLFSSLESYKSWGTLKDHLKVDFKKNFEKTMGKMLVEESSIRSEVRFPLSEKKALLSELQWDMADYFFSSFHLKEDSLYEQLLDRVVKQSATVQFSTLNYETLLIQAATKFMREEVLTEFISFPHGCSSFYCTASITPQGAISGSAPGDIVEFYPSMNGNLQASGSISMIKSYEEFKRLRKLQNIFPPVMCYIEPEKYISGGVNFIQEQRAKWVEQVSSAEKILIIGVRINRRDRHIWDLLSESPAKILYISGEEGACEFDDWKKKCRSELAHSLPKYWEQATQEVFDFLEV